MEKVRNKVILIGPMPPPLGGVSIHLERLSFLLDKEFAIDYIDESHLKKEKYFNLRSFNVIKYCKKIVWSDLLYIHSGGKILKIIHVLFGKIFNKKIILTIHSYPATLSVIPRFLDEFVFSFADRVIIVNPKILERLSLPIKKCIVLAAFIPPKMDDETTLPSSVMNWIESKKKENKLIICANAWQLKRFNGQDLYGLDLCIEVAKQLIHQGYQIVFIFVVSSIEKHGDAYLDYQSIIKREDLTENFLLLNLELSFVKLIEKSDLVLRPTNTDGDALTIREALYLDKPIIASDAVSRPNGTILFKTRDVNDLKSQIIQIIKNRNAYNIKKVSSNSVDYQKIYSDIIKSTIFKSN